MIELLMYYIKNLIKKIIAPVYSPYAVQKKRFLHLKRGLPAFLKEPAHRALNKKLLILGMVESDLTDLIYGKALQDSGYAIHVLTHGFNPYIDKILKLFPIAGIYYFDHYLRFTDTAQIRFEAKEALKKCHSHRDILALTKFGINYGKYAVSSVIRKTRTSGFDIQDPDIRIEVEKALGESLRALFSSIQLIDEIKPDLFFTIERGYTPSGQLFDACLQRKIPVIQRCGSHKSGYEIVKRYDKPEMSINHHQSLSRESWEYVRSMEWDHSKWNKLYHELRNTYASGDWFSEVGTQFNKKLYDEKELSKKLGLDSNKKTAVIFPHMFWDATFFWGKDLFNDYYDWFVNVLCVAAKNESLNWIIKIHPANTVKAKRDNYKGEHKELTAIKDTLGRIPDHIQIIHPESDINTFSLFSIMNYCLTVRGTIGIESALMGIPVITAGTGRYDRHGFTYDFDTKEDYLNFIAQLHELPPMSAEKTELARKYAYGIFILRTIHLDLLEHGYNQDEKASMKFKLLSGTRNEFDNSVFKKTFEQFVLSGKEDYLREK